MPKFDFDYSYYTINLECFQVFVMLFYKNWLFNQFYFAYTLNNFV